MTRTTDIVICFFCGTGNRLGEAGPGQRARCGNCHHPLPASALGRLAARAWARCWQLLKLTGRYACIAGLWIAVALLAACLLALVVGACYVLIFEAGSLWWWVAVGMIGLLLVTWLVGGPEAVAALAAILMVIGGILKGLQSLWSWLH